MNNLQVDYDEIEKRKTITFGEFKMWIQGLIVGKRGKLPDVNDWIRIKQMMDKVVPYEIEKIIPVPISQPCIPPVPDYPPIVPMPTYQPWYTTCGGPEYDSSKFGTDYDSTKIQKLVYGDGKSTTTLGNNTPIVSSKYIIPTNDVK